MHSHHQSTLPHFSPTQAEAPPAPKEHASQGGTQTQQQRSSQASHDKQATDQIAAAMQVCVLICLFTCCLPSFTNGSDFLREEKGERSLTPQIKCTLVTLSFPTFSRITQRILAAEKAKKAAVLARAPRGHSRNPARYVREHADHNQQKVFLARPQVGGACCTKLCLDFILPASRQDTLTLMSQISCYVLSMLSRGVLFCCCRCLSSRSCTSTCLRRRRLKQWVLLCDVGICQLAVE